MATTSFFSAVNSLTLLALVLSLVTIRAQSATNVPPTGSISTATGGSERQKNSEDLGYDVFGGKTNKIAKVYSATPVWIYVIYEGNSSGRKIPRQDLNPQLRPKYPYDEGKAQEYLRQQAAASARETIVSTEQTAKARVAAGEVATAELSAKEQAVLAEIAQLRERDAELAREVSKLRSQPPGQGRRKSANELAQQQQNVRDRITQLKAQVETIRTQKDKLLKPNKTIQDEIASLKKRDAELQQQIDALSNLPKGHGRRNEVLELKGEQQDVKKRIKELESQLNSSSHRAR